MCLWVSCREQTEAHNYKKTLNILTDKKQKNISYNNKQASDVTSWAKAVPVYINILWMLLKQSKCTHFIFKMANCAYHLMTKHATAMERSYYYHYKIIIIYVRQRVTKAHRTYCMFTVCLIQICFCPGTSAELCIAKTIAVQAKPRLSKRPPQVRTTF